MSSVCLNSVVAQTLILCKHFVVVLLYCLFDTAFLFCLRKFEHFCDLLRSLTAAFVCAKMKARQAKTLKMPTLRGSDRTSAEKDREKVENPLYGSTSGTTVTSDEKLHLHDNLTTTNKLLQYFGVRPYPIFGNDANQETLYLPFSLKSVWMFRVDVMFLIVSVINVATLLYVVFDADEKIEFLSDPRQIHSALQIKTSGYDVVKNIEYAVFLSLTVVIDVLTILNLVKTSTTSPARRRTVSTVLQLIVKITTLTSLNRLYSRSIADHDYLDQIHSISITVSEFDEAITSARRRLLFVGSLAILLCFTHVRELVRHDKLHVRPDDQTTVGIVNIRFFVCG